MRKIFLFILKLFVFTGILYVPMIVIANLKYGDQHFTEITSAYIFSIILFVLGFLGTIWSLDKSLKTFMTTVFGGMVARIFLVVGAVYVVLRYTSFDIRIFISVFFLFYIIFQIFEFRYFNKNVKKGSA
ncbi:hypothetical protein B6D60_10940 [candidate division KSB1 bacterium 4484_87]|nr:MAG: hypothetical protein B6D60_10940 [candidate division KSB1 bacterium 4484_87]